MGACGSCAARPPINVAVDIVPPRHRGGGQPRAVGRRGGAARPKPSPPESESSAESATLGHPKGAARPGSIRRDMFIHKNVCRITDSYSMADKVGQGMFGSVFRATHRTSGSVRAIKFARAKNSKAVTDLHREIAIMKAADHPNIVRIYETFESTESLRVWMVMELCEGGPLVDRIISLGRFAEADAANVMRDVFRAVCYLHGQGIVHRDLKPENFLLATKGPIATNVLKVIDFGLSTWIPTGGRPLHSRVGTPLYVAPEVLEGKYGPAIDCWSAGAIMYLLLSGEPPFFSQSISGIFAKVRKSTFSFSSSAWNSVSSDAQVLITRLLEKQSCARYTPAQALDHVWIKKQAPAAKPVGLDSGFIEKLDRYRAQNKLKKAVLQIIAGQLGDEKLEVLRDAFVTLDTDSDGLLNAAELGKALDQAGLNAEKFSANNMFDGIDVDGSGEIDYTEFLAAFLDRDTYLHEDRCRSAFGVLDIDGDGRLSKEELRTLLFDGVTATEQTSPAGCAAPQLGHDLPTLLTPKSATRRSELNQLMTETDLDGDGTIDFKEFMTFLEKSTPVGAKSFFRHPLCASRRV